MAFCLAGALSFNLAAPDSSDNTPVFAQLMLDECSRRGVHPTRPLWQHVLGAFARQGTPAQVVEWAGRMREASVCFDRIAIILGLGIFLSF